MTSFAQVPEERRKQRSTDPLVALHYQLAQSKTRSSVEAIVLADPSGVVVAGAGSWVVCEELAAYAPLFSQGQGAGQSRFRPPGARRCGSAPTVKFREMTPMVTSDQHHSARWGG